MDSLCRFVWRLAESTDKHTLARLGAASVLVRVVLVAHALNIAAFLFVKSSWQALANWQGRLLPDRANAVLMLLSYYLIIAICKVTWKDMESRFRSFAANKQHAAR